MSVTKVVVKTVEEFVERIKRKESVSRFKVELGFKWNAETSKVLREANLSEADLSDADLRWADLREANLRWADLSEADLRWADLSGANLRWADLSEADLRGMKGAFTFNFGVKLKVVK